MLGNLTTIELEYYYSSSFDFKWLRKYWNVYSVTSIISILGWLEFVSKEVLAKACANWTALHEDIENTYKHWRFILWKTLNKLGWLKFYTAIWKEWWVVELEKRMITSQVGGTADAIMKIDWKLTMVDWKSYWWSVQEELFKKYKMQISQYTSMYNELYNTNIEQAKIVCFDRRWWYRIIDLDKDELIEYKKRFDETYNKFKEYESRN